ncbi:hypothetical protein [Nocardioides sp.]|uniref:hypothetical protein n=1 Tax=Nocardioides sp. TaxID=35761 RepID=UPI0025FC4E9A|nr:hypothetical protein [Nocardioides sp.]
MYAGGLDGLDFVVQAVPDAGPVVGLYADLLGFEVARDQEPDPAATRLLGLPGVATRSVHLRRGSGIGGDVVVVEIPTLEPEPRRVPERRAGVYALDFYLRDAAATERALSEAGWAFVSEAVHYDLPGTDIPVRERMLVQHHSGLLHALVQHRPRGTRSVLGTDEDGWSSEVVAVVVLTSDLPAARRFAAEVLGGHEYFAGTFAGPAIEEMLEYDAGEGLEASLYRGPGSRNARLEFARPVDGSGRPLPLPSRPDRRVQPGIVVHDLDALLSRLDDGEHGRVAAVGDVDLLGPSRRAVRFDTSYDVSLMLVEAGAPVL